MGYRSLGLKSKLLAKWTYIFVSFSHSSILKLIKNWCGQTGLQTMSNTQEGAGRDLAAEKETVASEAHQRGSPGSGPSLVGVWPSSRGPPRRNWWIMVHAGVSLRVPGVLGSPIVPWARQWKLLSYQEGPLTRGTGGAPGVCNAREEQEVLYPE